MKKILFLGALMLLITPAFAAVGYVDYNVIYQKLPISKSYQTKIDAKAEAVRKYNQETKSMLEGKTFEQRQQINNSRKENLYKIEREYINLRYKQQEVVTAKVKAAADSVLVSKKLDAIVDKKSVISGGVDCTNDILKAIK